VYVTVVFPTLKLVPEASLFPVPVVAPVRVYVTRVPGQLSEKAVGAIPFTIGVQEVTLVGHVIVGASVSLTVTVKEHEVVLLAASVAVYVTVVVPTGKVAPLANPAVKAVLTPGQLSVPTGAV
jgi:hypothetical protein